MGIHREPCQEAICLNQALAFRTHTEKTEENAVKNSQLTTCTKQDGNSDPHRINIGELFHGGFNSLHGFLVYVHLNSAPTRCCGHGNALPRSHLRNPQMSLRSHSWPQAIMILLLLSQQSFTIRTHHPPGRAEASETEIVADGSSERASGIGFAKQLQVTPYEVPSFQRDWPSIRGLVCHSLRNLERKTGSEFLFRLVALVGNLWGSKKTNGMGGVEEVRHPGHPASLKHGHTNRRCMIHTRLQKQGQRLPLLEAMRKEPRRRGFDTPGSAAAWRSWDAFPSTSSALYVPLWLCPKSTPAWRTCAPSTNIEGRSQ